MRASEQIIITSLLGGAGIPSWVPNRSNPPDIAINWTTNQVWKKSGGLTTPAALSITTSRASNATNLLPTSPSGFSYSTFGSGVTVQSSLGRQTYQAATNLFLNSTAPVTQTITLSATGSYTLWVNGSGSAAIAAGTATITGAGTATNGSPVTINCTATGTVVVTVSGSLQAVQLEAGTFGTPFIVTTGASAARLADVTSMPVSVASAYTLFGQATPQAPVTFSAAQVLLSVDDGTTNNRSFLARTSSTGNFAPNMVSGGTTEWGNTSAAVWAQGVSGKAGASFSAGSQNGYFNGVAVIMGTGATLPISPTTLHFGVRADGTTSFLNGLATIDAIWLTQAIPNAQLQALMQ